MGTYVTVSAQAIRQPHRPQNTRPDTGAKDTSLKILSINLNSLMRRLQLSVIQDYAKDFDILCFQETKLDSADLKNIDIPDFLPLYNNRKKYKNKSGGLAVFVKGSIFSYCSEVKSNDNECVQWVKVGKQLLGFDLMIGNTYIPGTGSAYYKGDEFETLYNDILDMTADYECEMCLIGDFNSKTSNFKDYLTLDSTVATETGLDEHTNIFISDEKLTELGIPLNRINQDKAHDAMGEKLLNFCKTSGLLIVNGRVGSDHYIGSTTCESKTKTGHCMSTIDYALASPSLFKSIHDFKVDIFDKTLSDVHCPLSITLSHKVQPKKSTIQPSQSSSNNTVTKKAFKTKWNSDKQKEFKDAFDSDVINNIILLLDSINPEITTQGDLDEVTERIKQVYKEAGSSIGIVKVFTNVNFSNGKLKKKTSNQPWFTKECNRKRKLLYNAKHRHRKIRSVASESLVRSTGKKYRLEINKAVKEFNSQIHKKLRALKTSNPKEYWAILNNDSPAINKIATELLLDHFKKLSQSPNNQDSNTNSMPEFNSSSLNVDESFNLPFTHEEIKKQNLRLKNGKASGIDSIINEFIKHSPPNMITLLTKYFNIILVSGIIPTDWSLGVIVPIYKKKGDIKDPDNYRGITLLSCVGKLFTVVLNSRLSSFLENNNLLGLEQAGFRTGYSTLDHIFTLHCIIDLYTSKKKKLYCAFVDYKKAFDTVDRYSLWQKLINIGIHGNLFTVIQNMYKNAKSCVQGTDGFSEFFACNIGVRQGENLSPLLFSIFLNDLEQFLSKNSEGIQFDFNVNNLECFIKIYTLLYADDTILISESPKNLQLMLDSLHSYCEKWKLQVNTSKTKIVIFSRGLAKSLPTWTFGPHNLEVVSDYVYLGIVFNFNGKFTKAINKQVLQARRASYSVIAKSRKFQLPIDIQFHLFDTCIMPILLYGCEIWGCSNFENVEIFHNQFCKYILKLGTKTVNNMALGELGRFKIEKHIKQKMLNFWVRINTSNSNKICLALYQNIKYLYDTGKHESKWLKSIKSTLEDLQLDYLWEFTPDQMCPHTLKSLFDQNLHIFYGKQWKTQIENSSACDTYTIFKTEFRPEQYLTLLEPKYAIPICKFRTNNHRLPVVIGRYNKIPRQNRKCILCPMNVVGDEYHYLLECEHFKLAREKLIDPEFTSNPNTLKMKHLLNSTERHELEKLSQFTSIILKHFINHDFPNTVANTE